MCTRRSARPRGGLISLLISIQLLVLDILTRAAIKQMLRQLAVPPSVWTQGLRVAIDVILLVSLWLYYDSINDRGFEDFCQRENVRPLWAIPPHSTELTVTILTATPILCFPSYDLFIRGGTPRIVAALLAPIAALIITAGGRILILAHLRSTWAAQKELRTGKEKVHTTVSRILYAAVFFLSLGLAVWVSIGLFAPQIIKIAVLIPQLPLWLMGTILGLFLAEETIHFTVLALARRRFLSRLHQLSNRGRITYSPEGHPYLSILLPFLYVGLTVVHHTKVSNLEKQTVYRVGIINSKRRKNVLILCQNQVYRLMHKLPGQGLIFRPRAHGRAFYKPLYVWFEDHAFDFPEGEGERILLVDPFPSVAAVQEGTEDWFLELDNGSHTFGYTVYGLNAFLHVLERSE